MVTDFPQPRIVIETREQTPFPIAGKTVRGTLITSGDYSFVGDELLFSCERKSLADLVQSLTIERDRFLRECERLHGYRFAPSQERQR